MPVQSSIEPPTRPVSAARRIVSAQSSGASPKPFSRSAATGRSTASTMARALASDSSRVISPSRRPSTPAAALLEVASAVNPIAANAFALPASQALAMTKVRPCSARNASAFWVMSTLMSAPGSWELQDIAARWPCASWGCRRKAGGSELEADPQHQAFGQVAHETRRVRLEPGRAAALALEPVAEAADVAGVVKRHHQLVVQEQAAAVEVDRPRER